ncbi:MAG: flagellar hook protein FlgE [Dongiaceae bacterium]
MSLYGAMFSGVSGLAAQSQALGMISDNISNVNTIGYKGTTARFETLVTEAASRTTYSPGGVRSIPYQKIDRQGLLQGSASPTDIAIVGNGFFVVNEDSSPGVGDDYLFTRAGNFTTDQNGNLTANGYYLQGWRLDAGGALPANTSLLTTLETVNVSNLTGAARATSNMQLALNLPAQVANGEEFTTTMQIFDKQGATQTVNLNWTKTATNSWSLTADLPGTARFASDDTGTATTDNGQTTPVALGTVTFNADGTLGTVTATAPYAAVNADNQFEFYIDYDGSATTTSTQDRALVSLDIGSPGVGDGITQYSGEYSPKVISQDGLTFGSFTGIVIDERGTVTALFDNGQQRDIFKLPLATFRNPNGLESRNGNAYLTTSFSGDPVLLEANTGGSGKIAPSSLESSTVDLAEEFTNMIVTQRAYSANAKIITTADQMLDELINIRR